MKDADIKYMQRAINLAKNGFGKVSPNPMVGCVIVYDKKIIGEGYHQKYGEAHAEVNAINSVKDKSLLKSSKMYVSLEPCSHYGKTPPCTQLIINSKIPELIVSCLDPNPKVAGQGIKQLSDANIKLRTGVLEKQSIELNKRFFTFHQHKRPYIILKWAETSDGFIDKVRSSKNTKPASISNRYSKVLVHKWRTEEDAFLVGSNTVIKDDPKLSSRLFYGKNPVRLIIDPKNELIGNKYNIFNTEAKTLVFNSGTNKIDDNIEFIKIKFGKNSLENITDILYQRKISSIVVEGGTYTINKFIDNNLWDEARIFVSEDVFGTGVTAPKISNYSCYKSTKIDDNQVLIKYRENVFASE